jgi:hypothetical protein
MHLAVTWGTAAITKTTEFSKACVASPMELVVVTRGVISTRVDGILCRFYSKAKHGSSLLKTSIASATLHVAASISDILDRVKHTFQPIEARVRRFTSCVVNVYGVMIVKARMIIEGPRRTVSSAAKSTSSKVASAAVGAKKIASDKTLRLTAKSAARGAAAFGASGCVSGGTVGGAVGCVFAVFTAGLSIPIGVAVGSGAGLCIGTTVGSTVGFFGGAARGYDLQIHGAEVASKIGAWKNFVQELAVSSASYVTRTQTGGRAKTS